MTDDELDAPALTAFVAVVDAGSAHGAARRLGISQAALSRRLQRLEAALGARLFVRAGRRLALSDDGAKLLPKVRDSLDKLASALAEVRDTARYGRPTITFGCLPTLSMHVLPSILAPFLNKNPALRVRIVDLSATEIRNQLIAGSLDFAVTILGAEEPTLSQQLIVEEPMVLVVPITSPLSKHDELSWSDLKNIPVIAIGPLSGNRRLLEQVTASAGLKLNWCYEVQHMATAIPLVAAGIGATILPMLAIDPEKREGIKIITLSENSVKRRLGTLQRAGEKLSREADALRRELSAKTRVQLLLMMKQMGAGLN